MADYGDNDIGVLGGAFKGFAQGMMDAEDRAYKKMEMTAKLTAQREDKERQRAEDAAKKQEQEYRKKKDLLEMSEKYDVPSGVTDVTQMPLNPAPSERYLKTLAAKAEATAGAKQPTEAESAAGGFAARMELAERELEKLGQEGFDPGALGNSLQEEMPSTGVLGKLAESKKSPQVKRFQQAKNNFVSAVLRKESGASIPRDERAAEEVKYFPQAGDTPEVIEQKRMARMQALANLKAQGARATPRINTQMGLINQNGLIGRGLIKPAPPVDPEVQKKIDRLNALKAKQAAGG